MEVKKRSVALIQADSDLVERVISKVGLNLDVYLFENGLKFYQWLQKGGKIDVIVSAGGVNSSCGIALNKQLKSEPEFRKIPFIILTNKLSKELKLRLSKERISEVFLKDFNPEDFLLRVNWLIENPVEEKESKLSDSHIRYKIPTSKRIFDIAVALIAILLLSPVFLLVTLIIKLESRGPIFYIAKRVGRGYTIFDFYKFRSMRVGADAQMKDLAHLNQYKKNESEAQDQPKDEFIENKEHCPVCSPEGVSCQSYLYLKGNPVCEKLYLHQKKIQDEGKFIKFSNDPRVTKIGKFIRNTSIDELPQLFNVLKGDMSIVGNRPLPLYEAEKITLDEFNLRFMAPAGITGLWQVTKRGTSEMSELERMQLDNQYAANYSLAGDIKIMLRTIPALMQKENV